MKVAFYYNNYAIKDVDCSNISDGNPGIGGTHYAMLQVADALSKSNKIDCYLLAESTSYLPNTIKIIKASSFYNLPSIIRENNIDILIVNKTNKESLTKQMLNILDKTNVKVLVWAHVFMSTSFLDTLFKQKCVNRIICVSKHQQFTLCDHPSFIKSSHIFNICNFKNPINIIPFNEREYNVVYVGAINYIKGVHLLTNCWKKVIKIIPNANLYIIGSGHLYSNKDKLGPFGITVDFYEKELVKNILDEKGEIIPSIHFLGIMGKEKWNILNKCRVGIVNTHYWETFGYTAVEMQLAGLNIVSYKSPGIIDTVHKNSGILYEKEDELTNAIVTMLLKENNNYQNSLTYINQHFSEHMVINEWLNLFNEVYYNKDSKICTIETDMKFIKWQLLNRKFKKYIPFLPSLNLYHEIFLKFKKYIFRCKSPKHVFYKIVNVLKISSVR